MHRGIRGFTFQIWPSLASSGLPTSISYFHFHMRITCVGQVPLLEQRIYIPAVPILLKFSILHVTIFKSQPSRTFTLLYYNDHLNLTKIWWVHDVQILQLELTASNEWLQTMHTCMHSTCLYYCNLHLVVNSNLYRSSEEKHEFTSILRFALCTWIDCISHITCCTRAEILMIFWRSLSKNKIVTIPKY